MCCRAIVCGARNSAIDRVLAKHQPATAAARAIDFDLASCDTKVNVIYTVIVCCTSDRDDDDEVPKSAKCAVRAMSVTVGTALGFFFREPTDIRWPKSVGLSQAIGVECDNCV